jgi:thiamine-phosphate pyrophosphorylase
LKIQNKRFVYLISPTKIPDNTFFKSLELVFKSKKVSFFQLRLKNEKLSKKILFSKKIIKICRKYNVKFLVNDDPILALKVNADGCHLGQKDMSIIKAKKILKNKIIGITCHNSISLAKKALVNGANYIAVGAFYKTKTKKVKFRAKLSILRKIKKLSGNPIVAIGGINEKNYRKLLLNKANFLAISGYIWNNNKYKPNEAIERLK